MYSSSISKQNSDLQNYYKDEILPSNYYYSENFTWIFQRIGNIVSVDFNSLKNIPISTQVVVFESIPERYTPRKNANCRIVDIGNSNKIIEISFKPTGEVLAINYTGNSSTSYNMGGTFMFIGKEI